MTSEYQAFPNEEGRNNRQSQLEIPAMVRALGIPSGKRILEVGCGRGVALPVIDRLCSPRLLVGLDIDPELLAEAAANLREHGTRAQLCAADVRRMPFADGAFDVLPHRQAPGRIGRDRSGPRSGRDVRPRDDGLAVALASGPLARSASAAVGA
jgi:protein-L-isoaspartate O-methyltransferase